MILYLLMKGKHNRYHKRKKKKKKKNFNYAIIACTSWRKFTPPPGNALSDPDHVSCKSM